MDKQENRLEEQDKRISLLENYVVDMHRDIQFLSDFVRTYVNDSSAEVSSKPSGMVLLYFFYDFIFFQYFIRTVSVRSNENFHENEVDIILIKFAVIIQKTTQSSEMN